MTSRIMDTYARLPLQLVRGEGCFVFADDGRKYLDFVAGIAVNALGHAHPAVTDAIAEQSSRLVHTSNLYRTEPQEQLATRLCELLQWPDGKVFFANSGAEANECALKLVRKWSLLEFGPGRLKTIAALGSFHGRTFATLAATGQPQKWAPFMPLPEGFVHIAYDSKAAITAAASAADVSSILLEPVQGEAGVVVPSQDYLSYVSRLSDDNGLALILDEVQTGIGRTGNWFAFQENVPVHLERPFDLDRAPSHAVPGIVTLAKALGNGLPIGACVARGPWAETFRPGDHATTMGGGPVVCAAALAVLETIESEGLVDSARLVGDYLLSGLRQMAGRHGAIEQVRGKGLLLGIELTGDFSADIVVDCLKSGLLVNNVTPAVIRLSPPLIVGREECDTALAVLDQVFAGRHE
ncbi:MAG: acetylornithine transaminase [Actinomycetota bacterium]